jgi:hypothetical protein
MAWRQTPGIADRHHPRGHRVRFSLERRLVVDGRLAGERGLADTSRALLDDVPALMRQMTLLAGPEVNAVPLGIGERAKPRRPRRVRIDTHVVEAHSGERFEAAA